MKSMSCEELRARRTELKCRISIGSTFSGIVHLLFENVHGVTPEVPMCRLPVNLLISHRVLAKDFQSLREMASQSRVYNINCKYFGLWPILLTKT
ncbi:hypothetical protein TNCT_590851 [Trichonephila clavata]|uniref:Uncharacterized protein n=1 Tax=Trichonephila clavata TaxID=2740835 RepID=A0A8X6K9J1_TRICU|nr:hypothetical protein TNCT_590851 [Trichonephila clavata]